MCRLLGSVSHDPVSLRHELLDAKHPLIHGADENDSGWGLAVYPRGEGEAPRCTRFPDHAAAGDEFEKAADSQGRILMAHVRKATVGGLTAENTHPFCLGEYAFCHNGTLGSPDKLLAGQGEGPRGQTDSERIFHRLLREVDPAPDRVVEGLRRAMTAAARCAPLSGLNFLFSDGEHLYAYRLGLFDLHWLAREGQILVASERMTRDEPWHDVRQDVLLVIGPGDDEPHAERLLGDDVMSGIQIDPFDDGSGLRGAERGRFAAERASASARE
jgi:glutamine amidotransferase